VQNFSAAGSGVGKVVLQNWGHEFWYVDEWQERLINLAVSYDR
jgi:hypothetical protein